MKIRNVLNMRLKMQDNNNKTDLFEKLDEHRKSLLKSRQIGERD